ncbi:flagellar motor protein MotB [Pseudodesulfovibrio sp.]|uniref:flagellar motor protein MotB n=1 Tax=unclassified Pseudodesulfovibrio TaxID=2661612 RepID=UPI003AFFC7C6
MAKEEAIEQEAVAGGPAPEAPKKEEGIPAWMATFADMVTLLLCFFVLLLSFTNTDVTNFKRMLGSIQEALGVQLEDSSATNTPYAETSFKERRTVKERREIVELGARLKQFIRAHDLTNMARVSNDKSGVMLRFSNMVLFGKGSAKLTPMSQKALDIVIEGMENKNFNLIIRGHTDGALPESSLYNSNWELSAARAATCLRYILTHSNIPATRMKAVGYASAKPLFPSTTEVNKQKNRRVEFFFLPAGRGKW